MAKFTLNASDVLILLLYVGFLGNSLLFFGCSRHFRAICKYDVSAQGGEWAVSQMLTDADGGLGEGVCVCEKPGPTEIKSMVKISLFACFILSVYIQEPHLAAQILGRN